jgi:hypothetical protein
MALWQSHTRHWARLLTIRRAFFVRLIVTIFEKKLSKKRKTALKAK